MSKSRETARGFPDLDWVTVSARDGAEALEAKPKILRNTQAGADLNADDFLIAATEEGAGSSVAEAGVGGSATDQY